MYADFVSVVGGALCIIMAGLFIPYLSTYLERWGLLPIFYIIIPKLPSSKSIYPFPFYLRFVD